MEQKNFAAAELIQKNIDLVGMPAWTEEEQTFAKALQKDLKAREEGMPTKVDALRPPTGVSVGGGSSDVGDVTMVAPTASIRFPGQVPGAIGHHWSSVACNYGSTAWKGLNAGAKAITASAIDLLTKPEELKKPRTEFEEYSKTHPYKSFLPADAKPPLEINEELMRKIHPLLEKYEIKYKRKREQFTPRGGEASPLFFPEIHVVRKLVPVGPPDRKGSGRPVSGLLSDFRFGHALTTRTPLYTLLLYAIFHT